MNKGINNILSNGIFANCDCDCDCDCDVVPNGGNSLHERRWLSWSQIKGGFHSNSSSDSELNDWRLAQLDGILMPTFLDFILCFILVWRL